ncbi:putative ribosome-binding factor A, mitochondrial isoform X1 [Pteropus medius]|uniref:putative ribosome-binding factor A, mitochondrial isoform X1 n=1 Tax=Pteropus vampyrus TaxID=132908 RepID=UPI00196B0744|nr:putative ribosome-binding factor A, mitochondrial isoform X1 [Pteropus giganteus]
MSVVAHRLGSLRAGFQALPGARHAGILGGARDLHGSPVSCGKNLLKKFAAKTKKKFWYEGPSLGPHLAFRFLPAAPSVSQYSLMPAVCLSCPETYKPSQLESLTKSTSRKTRKEDGVRLRALNGLLHKALTDLLCTPEVSQELCDLNVELSKVSLTADFSACRVYWKATPRAERDARAGAALRRSAAQMSFPVLTDSTRSVATQTVRCGLVNVSTFCSAHGLGNRSSRVTGVRGCGHVPRAVQSARAGGLCPATCRQGPHRDRP